QRRSGTALIARTVVRLLPGNEVHAEYVAARGQLTDAAGRKRRVVDVPGTHAIVNLPTHPHERIADRYGFAARNVQNHLQRRCGIQVGQVGVEPRVERGPAKAGDQGRNHSGAVSRLKGSSAHRVSGRTGPRPPSLTV